MFPVLFPAAKDRAEARLHPVPHPLGVLALGEQVRVDVERDARGGVPELA
jgi:hypothetical protein